MIVWGPGQRPRLMGCGTALLVGVVIFLLVYALSGGQCNVFIFP